MHKWLTVGAGALALAAAALAPSRGPAQTAYPDRSVRIIVPTSPGGSIDAVARTIGGYLSNKWGKPVVIENRSGAAMMLGVDAVAKSAPDGYTLLVAHDGAMAMNPALYPNLPYAPMKDFTPIALMMSIPEVIMVNASTGAKTLREFVELAKRDPGKLNHATGGPASMLALELFKKSAGVDIASVQYRGAAPSVLAVISGEAQMCITDSASATPAMQSDRVRTLAVTTLKRAKRFPDLPTADEAGVPGYNVQVWIGMFAPAGLPADIRRTIESAVQEALARPDIREKFESIGVEIRSGTADELRNVLAADIPQWQALVKEKNLQIKQ